MINIHKKVVKVSKIMTILLNILSTHHKYYFKDYKEMIHIIYHLSIIIYCFINFFLPNKNLSHNLRKEEFIKI